MEFLDPLLEKIDSMGVGLVSALPNIGLAAIVLFVTWILALVAKKIVTTLMKHSHARKSLQALFQTVSKVIVWILGILIALTIIFPSLTPAKMIATLGLGSVAIGFAFKDVFENFLAGILIMLRKPMRIGDYIECESVEGDVEEITIRDTYIRKLNNELILVPNSYLFKNPVYVKTDKSLHRFEIVCGVGYDEDADKAKDIIQKAVEDIDIIEKSKPVQVFACEFNSSSIDYTVRWWTKSRPIDMHESRDAVIRAIKRALDDAGIEIPYPYRTLTFKGALPVEQEKDEKTEEEPKKQKSQNKTGKK